MKYISVDEVLMGRVTLDELSDEQIRNLNTIVPRVNDLLDAFGEYRKVTSGYRSPADQQRINPSAPKSKHLLCAAIDLSDPDGKLAAFCMANLPLIAKIGLWLENPTKTKGWVHAQCLPPKSGSRVFNP
jgi:hypothetical protein